MKLGLAQRQQEAFEFIVPLAPASVEIVQSAEVILLGGGISAAARPRQRAADAALLAPNGLA
jgi:hypothetical protein